MRGEDHIRQILQWGLKTIAIFFRFPGEYIDGCPGELTIDQAFPECVKVYDFTTGISWKLHMFSFGAHADAEPLKAEDTANMRKAFGNQTTWNPKAVWVVFSDGRVYMASTHDTPHGVDHTASNDFAGHLCVHFPRTAEQVAAIGSYATSHQKAIDLGWAATLARISQ